VTTEASPAVHYPACNERCVGDSHYLIGEDGPAQSGAAARTGLSAVLATSNDHDAPTASEHRDPDMKE
jgi:hypothetical protein